MDTTLEAFSDVIRRHQATVYAAAFGVTGDRGLSEDVVQETFVVAWRDRPALRDQDKLPQWLRGIARNLAKQARAKAGPVAELAVEQAGADPRDESVADEEVRITWAAVGELPESYREAIVMYYWEDQSARDVATALEITEQAVQQRLSRGRALLREEVLRRVEGALRRGRPGAAMTAAIVAAVAAAGAKTASASIVASAKTPAVSAIAKAPVRNVARALIVGAAALVIALVVGVVIYVRGTSAHAASDITTGAVQAVVTQGGATGKGTASPLASTTTSGQGPGSTGAATAGMHAPSDDNPDADDPDGSYVAIKVEGAAGSREVYTAAEKCFLEPFLTTPAQLHVTVRNHVITRVSVSPSSATISMLDESMHPLSQTEAEAWLAAGKSPITYLDPAGGLSVDKLVAICAKNLVGLAMNGPDGDRTITVGGEKVTPKKIDKAGYTDLDITHGPSRGPADAKVTIIAFVALEDQFSAKLIGTLDQVLAKYPKEVRVVVKPVGLSGEVNPACEAVLAANAQGAMWPMLARIDSGHAKTVDELVAAAGELGLDTTRFRTELTQHTYRDELELIADQRTTMDITALPSSLVNGKRVHGSLPLEDFTIAIEQALHP